MKKKVFIAALAVVAMASCTKNELKVPSTGSDAVISFQPVVANATKAGYLTTDNMKTACPSFGVFAWYPQGGGEMQASTTTGTQYMNNVTVTYNGSFNDNNDDGSGTWAPGTPYYWPKNGKLSFDAYAPASAHADTEAAGKGKFTSDIKKGLQITKYTVAALANQYDLLYSTRAVNKNTSNGGKTGDASYDGNGTYDGVDIAFKHALSAIEVKAKTAAAYGDDVIQLTGVTIQNAYNKGTFSQNMNSPIAEGSPEWTGHGNEVNYVLFSGAQSLSSTSVVESPTISNAIVLPQSFTHDPNKVSIKVDYQIKGTNGYLPQTQTFYLSDTMVGSTAQTGWDMGKKYTYTLVFTLEDIHFAPSVTDWTEVTVKDIDVK